MTAADLQLLMVAPSAVAGGMEEIFFLLADNLREVGVTPDVVCLQPGPLVDRLAARSVPVRVIDAGRMRDVRRFGRTSRAIARILLQGGHDAVYSNMPKAHLYAAPAAAHRRTPALWCQAMYPDPPHWTDRAATALPAAGVVALSHDAAAAQLRLNRRRTVHTLHPGIELARFPVRADPELRAEHNIDGGAQLVSLVGRLQPWKGQREFLHAAARLAGEHPTAHFAVVGGAILGWEGDYPQQLQELAAELGLAGRVTFTGHTQEVPRWMAASDIVVNASQPEPFGLVVIEAMAAGCAVVAVAQGGPRDIIEPDRSGLLCATNAPDDLARAIARLLGDQPLRHAVGTAARARVQESFSHETMVAGFAQIVRDTVA